MAAQAMGAEASWTPNLLPAGGAPNALMPRTVPNGPLPPHWPMGVPIRGVPIGGVPDVPPCRGHLVARSMATRTLLNGANNQPFDATSATHTFFNAVPAMQPFDGSLWAPFVERFVMQLVDRVWSAVPRAHRTVTWHYLSGPAGPSMGAVCLDSVAVPCAAAHVGAGQTVPMASRRWAILIADIVDVAGGGAGNRVAAVGFLCDQVSDIRLPAAGAPAVHPCAYASVNAIQALLPFDPVPPPAGAAGLGGAQRGNTDPGELYPTAAERGAAPVPLGQYYMTNTRWGADM
jgi:hypothetical protein